MVVTVNYSVSIRDDYIISVVDPETMDVNAAHQIANDIERCARILRGKGEPVLILVDVRPLKQDDAATRRIMIKRMAGMDFDRLAAFGIGYAQTKVANLMVPAARLIQDKPLAGSVKVFHNQQAAERWLKDFSVVSHSV